MALFDRRFSGRERDYRWLAKLALLPVLPLLLAIPQLSAPIFFDDAVYAMVSQGMLDGLVPYRDLFDHKPPLIYGWYAGVITLFGDSQEALRLSVFASLGVTSVLVYFCGREFLGRRQAYTAGLVFALSTGLATINPNASTVQLMLLPLMASFYFTLRWRRDPRAVYLVAAGITSGLALMVKPVALPNVFMLATIIALTTRSPRHLLAFGLPMVSVAALVLLPFALLGALPEALDAIVLFNREYVAGAVGRRGLTGAASLMGSWVLLLGPLSLLLAGSAWSLARSTVEQKRLVGGWAAASLVGVFSAGSFNSYYLVQFLPAAGFLIALFLGWLREPQSEGRRRAVLSFTSVGGMLLLIPVLVVYANYPTWTTHRYEAMGEISRILDETASPGDTLWVPDYTPQVYFLSGLTPATRYFYEMPFITRPETLDETLLALAIEPASFIVQHNLAASNPRLKRLLTRSYELLYATPDVQVFGLRSSCASPGDPRCDLNARSLESGSGMAATDLEVMQ
ncbi:MAG: hypothetical protein GEU80_04385 [Dehalococcoidia bacterium]|nr:hypothetical protein [Dehalococcoidia bacterium]